MRCAFVSLGLLVLSLSSPPVLALPEARQELAERYVQLPELIRDSLVPPR